MADRIKGTCLAIYPTGALSTSTKRILATARPSLVMPHGGPDALKSHASSMATEIRAIVPNVRLLLGVGCDEWTQQAISGEVTVQAAIDALVGAADTAITVGAIGVVYDAEGASETTNPIAAQIATAVLAAVRAKYPTLIICHTSYDDPVAVQWTDSDGHVHNFGGHSEYCWKEWCGPEGAAVDVPQVYFAASTGIAMPGSGPWRLARHRDSWAQAIAKGWIASTAQHAVYVQAHNSAVRDLCTVADQFSFRCFWAAGASSDGDTLDANGECALSVECELERRGQTIAVFQASAGLTTDGIVGEITCKALGVTWPG